MGWGPVARVARPRRPGRWLSVLLLALAVSWLTVGGAVRTVHDVTAGQRPSAVAQHAADAECRLLMGPDGPARCYHGGEHPAAGRLHPTGVAQDADGTGYPAAEPAASAERRSPTARPPSPPSLAELQIWRR